MRLGKTKKAEFAIPYNKLIPAFLHKVTKSAFFFYIHLDITLAFTYGVGILTTRMVLLNRKL
jgi:hypothetical protein